MKLGVQGRKVRLEAETQEEVDQLSQIWGRVGKRRGMVLYPRCLSTLHPPKVAPKVVDPRIRFPLWEYGSLVLEIGRRNRKGW